MAHEISLIVDPPQLVAGGKFCEVRLKATVVKKTKSGAGEKTVAAKGTLQFRKDDQPIMEGPVDDNGVFTHRLEIPLQNDQQSVRFDATFRSQAGEVAHAPYQRITIPPTHRDRRDKDRRQDWERVSYKLELRHSLNPNGADEYTLTADVTLTAHERRGEKDTRDVAVPGATIKISLNGKVASTGITDGAGKTLFHSVLRAREVEETFFMVATAEIDGKTVTASSTETVKVPAKRRTNQEHSYHKLSLHVMRQQAGENQYRYLLKATFLKVERRGDETKEHPVRDTPVVFTVNSQELSYGDKLPTTDATGEAFLQTGVYDSLDQEQAMYFLAKTVVVDKPVVSQTFIDKLPALAKPVPAVAANLWLVCRGNAAEVTLFDKDGKPCAAPLTIIPHVTNVAIHDNSGKEITAWPVNVPASVSVFFFFHEEAKRFSATFASGGASKTGIIYPEKRSK
ncbi:MAG: hypothetical protein HY609_04445 [Deltaproteobacteria bacterium]|nr:hypothetical protein [Deltaproteobacteria bacterium]